MKRLRFTALLLCAAVLLAALPQRAAAESPALTVVEATGRRGATVEVSVALQRIDAIASGGFNVTYDADALTLLSAEPGPALTGTSAVVNPAYAENAVRVSFAGTQALAQPGVVLTLRFRIGASAPFGHHAICLEQIKMMDVKSRVIDCTAGSGGVTVQGVSVGLGSATCAPGRETRLELELRGDLMPCGGVLELRYDPDCLCAASVVGETAIGGTPVTLTSRVVTDSGIIRITWASARPIGAMGKLCSLFFTAAEGAAGSTEIAFAEASFFDEDGRELETNACENGTITFEEAIISTPMLYMLGGERASDGTATVRLVIDGAQTACGGNTVLEYDTTLCRPVSVVSQSDAVTLNPTSLEAADGKIALAWAHPVPSEDAECLIEIKFAMCSDAAATLSVTQAVLHDKNGAALTANVYDGQVGVSCQLQKPIITVLSETEITGVLLDAALRSTDQPAGAKPVLAYYQNGQMIGVELPDVTIQLSKSGVSAFALSISGALDAQTVKLFLLCADGSFAPLCEAVCLSA